MALFTISEAKTVEVCPHQWGGIAGELRSRTSRPISLSSVHIALYRLEEKGFVRSELGGATSARGGRRKRLFTITALGQSTLAEIRQVRNDLWNAMPRPSLS